ncbi:Nsp1-like C-terminal region-domain-containing protein [Mycena rebaudengoi]|nr:Nsp1-like C-terminal region-domain-containing protein [Mycena rebaudengoi]
MSFFGNNNQPAAPSGGAFGNPASSTTPAAPSLFGGGTLGAKPAGTGSNIFGGGGAAAPASSGLFGNPTSTGASGGLFGGGGSDPKPQTSMFGGFGGASATPSATPANAPAAPSTNLFGTSTQPSASNPLFGGGVGAFSKPAEPAAASQQKPATSSFFSLSSTSSAAPAAPATAGFNLPSKPADSATTATPFGNPSGATAPAPSFSLGGPSKEGAAAPAAPAGGFFAKPAAAAGTAPAPAAAPSSPFTLGSLGGNKDGATTPAPSLFGLGKPEDKKDAPAATSAFGLSKPVAKEGEKTPTTLAGASLMGAGPAVAVAPPSMLRGKTIEEIVNKWSSELETHVREFNKFAGEVAVWDRALIENGNNLAALYRHVLSAEREQNDIDQSLDHIEQQQKDLASTLDAYEKATQEVFGGHGSLRALDTGPADTERDKNYMLATDLHTQLDDLSGSLTQMIDSVNALSLPSGPEVSGDDPMAQIAQILGSHLESLQWIDGAVREVEGKVTEVEKRVKDSGYNASAPSNGQKRGFL